MEILINAEQIRLCFIEYQSKFYDQNDMYDQIAQSDQNRSILAGGYDEYIKDNFIFEFKIVKK